MSPEIPSRARARGKGSGGSRGRGSADYVGVDGHRHLLPIGNREI